MSKQKLPPAPMTRARPVGYDECSTGPAYMSEQSLDGGETWRRLYRHHTRRAAESCASDFLTILTAEADYSARSNEVTENE